MKQTVCSIILTIALFLPAVSIAKKGKMQEVEVIEKYDIFYSEPSKYGPIYIVDPKMCLCLVYYDRGYGGGLIEVDCKKLAKLSGLEPHVQQCINK